MWAPVSVMIYNDDSGCLQSDDTRQMEKKNEELVAKLSDKDTSLEEMKVSTAKVLVSHADDTIV